jgi:hypothetical protein
MKKVEQSETTKLPFEDKYVRLRWTDLDGNTIFKCAFRNNLGKGDFETFIHQTVQAYVKNVLNTV